MTSQALSFELTTRYEKIAVIGRGSFGTVYKGIDKQTSNTVAIKVIDLESTEEDINDIMKEIITLKDCDSPYVTKYYASFNIGPELWIIMEYLGGGSAHDFLKPKLKMGIEEEYIAIIIRETVKGLEYLHKERKIHRDIKAANILLSSNGDVKLADFGVCGQLTETMNKRMTLIGSPYWMAPEVILQNAYDCAADIWSLGVTCIELAIGVPPHTSKPPYPAMLAITKQDPPTLDDDFGIDFRDFVSKCCIKEPKDRYTTSQLLKHPFLTKAGKISRLIELIRLNNDDYINSDNDDDDEFINDILKDNKNRHVPQYSIQFDNNNNNNNYNSDNSIDDEKQFGTMVRNNDNNNNNNNNNNSDDFDSGTTKFGTMVNINEEELKNELSNKTIKKKTYTSMGIQTTIKQTFNKSIQTKAITISTLQKSYNEIENLFSQLHSHVNENGKNILECLEIKVKKLSRLKLLKLSNDKKHNKNNSSNTSISLEERRNRLQLLRERRKKRKEEQMRKQKELDNKSG